MWAIQMVENFNDDEGFARQALTALAEQDGYLGGRVLPSSPEKPGYKVQAFFQDEPEVDGWLPDGMRRVWVPRGLAATLGMVQD